MIKQLFYLPLAFVFLFFECHNSPVKNQRIKWTSLYWFMIKIRVLATLSKNAVNINVKFLRHTFYASDYKTLEYLFHEIFVLGEYHVCEPEYKPELIYDCGANIGIATLFFKILYPETIIKAFEPNPLAYNILKRNVESNNLQNVHIYNIALAGLNEEIKLHFDDNNLVTGSLDKNRGEYNNSIKIQARQLSEFFRNDVKIDLVKIDVEGAEYMILEELVYTELIQRPIRYMIEYHNFTGLNKFGNFISLFSNLDYSYQMKADINRKKNYQDILIYLTRDE